MSKTAEGIFEKRFEKFRIGIFRSSLDHFLETGKLSGSALLEVREAMEEYAQQRVSELEKENERLKNDLLDALDLKEGKGPTALSMLSNRVKELEQSNKELVDASDRMGEAMDKLLKGLATDGVAIEGFTDAWTARHRYVELKLKIELSRTKEVVPDNKTV